MFYNMTYFVTSYCKRVWTLNREMNGRKSNWFRWSEPVWAIAGWLFLFCFMPKWIRSLTQPTWGVLQPELSVRAKGKTLPVRTREKLRVPTEIGQLSRYSWLFCHFYIVFVAESSIFLVEVLKNWRESSFPSLTPRKILRIFSCHDKKLDSNR